MQRATLTFALTMTLLLCGVRVRAGEEAFPGLADAEFRTACGPIAHHVALRVLGIDRKLAESVRACGWKEGELTTLETLCRTLDDVDGIQCSAVRISPSELHEYLSQTSRVAILAVKKDGPEIDHVCCVLQGTDGLIAIDYPGLAQGLSESRLMQIWDGEALLVSHETPPPIGRRLILSTAPGILAGALFWLAIDRRRVSKKGTRVQPAAP
jgi:hypothetical protein